MTLVARIIIFHVLQFYSELSKRLGTLKLKHFRENLASKRRKKEKASHYNEIFDCTQTPI